MRYSAEHKRKTREAILGAAGRVFRSCGYGGSGIDELTREAGVTNGAFYGHFRTKADAFREIVAIGLRRFTDGVIAAQAAHGPAWLEKFVDYYLGPMRTCPLGEACALPMLSAEVARAGAPAREVYAHEFARLVAAVAAGLDGDETRAMALLSMLSGAVTFARALPDPAAGDRLVAAVRTAALTLAAPALAPEAPAEMTGAWI